MKNKLFFLSLLLIPTFSDAQNNSAESNLKQVIEDFRTSIIARDGIEKFSNLFLHDSITWCAIVTNKTREMVLKQMPNFTFQSSNYRTFYNNLKEKTEEKFYNIKIDNQGKFASIFFNYTFSIDSEIQNWGDEYWSLMLVNDEWKITSVTWTMNKQQIEKCPFSSEKEFRLD